MAEQRLHGWQIGAAFDQMTCVQLFPGDQVRVIRANLLRSELPDNPLPITVPIQPALQKVRCTNLQHTAALRFFFCRTLKRALIFVDFR